MTPDGKELFVAIDPEQQKEGSIVPFARDSSTGTLRPQAPVDVGLAPQRIALTPGGDRLLVANFLGSRASGGVGTVTELRVDPDPASAGLSSLGDIRVGYFPSDIAIDPTGFFAYVTNSGQVDPSAAGRINVTDTTTQLWLSVIQIGSGAPLCDVTQCNPSKVYVNPPGVPGGPPCTPGSTSPSAPCDTQPWGVTLRLPDCSRGFRCTPSGVVVSPAGNAVYVSTQITENGTSRDGGTLTQISVSGTTQPSYGCGTGTTACPVTLAAFDLPVGLAVSSGIP